MLSIIIPAAISSASRPADGCAGGSPFAVPKDLHRFDLTLIYDQSVSLRKPQFLSNDRYLHKHVTEQCRMTLLCLHNKRCTCEMPVSPSFCLGMMSTWTGACGATSLKA